MNKCRVSFDFSLLLAFAGMLFHLLGPFPLPVVMLGFATQVFLWPISQSIRWATIFLVLCLACYSWAVCSLNRLSRISCDVLTIVAIVCCSFRSAAFLILYFSWAFPLVVGHLWFGY